MRRLLGMALVVLAVVAAGPGPLRAQALGESITPLEKEMLADADDGRLDDFSLVDAAFIASGVPDRKGLEIYRGKYRQLLGKVKRATRGAVGERERARRAFVAMHEAVLERYGLHAVDMIGVFSRGEYNCVSATILYDALLEELDIESSAVLVPSHTYALVRVDGEEVEVETTSPHGFAPARTEEAYRALLKQYRLDGALEEAKDGSRVSPSALIREVQGERQVVSRLTLVAVIYSNMAAARLRDGDLEGALSNFLKATRIAREDERFARSRDALLNNLVVDLIEAGDYPRAVEASRAARKVPGISADLADRLVRWAVLATSKQAIALGDAGRHEEAVATYDRARPEFPGNATLEHNRMVAFVNWGLHLLRTGAFRDAATVTLKALAEYPDADVVRNNYLATVQKYIRSRREAGDLDHALKVARHAHAQAAAVYERGGNPGDLLLRLELEVGLVHFVRKEYAAAIERFAPGLSTGDDLYATNYLAASANLARAFMNAGRPAEAWTAVFAARQNVGDTVAARHGFHGAFWPAALSQAEALRKAGKPLSALEIVAIAPASTVPPEVTSPYWQVRTGLLVELGRFAECRALLEGQGDRLAGSWLAERRRQCAEE